VDSFQSEGLVDFRHISVYAVETCEPFLIGVFRTDVNDDEQY